MPTNGVQRTPKGAHPRRAPHAPAAPLPATLPFTKAMLMTEDEANAMLDNFVDTVINAYTHIGTLNAEYATVPDHLRHIWSVFAPSTAPELIAEFIAKQEKQMIIGLLFVMFCVRPDAGRGETLELIQRRFEYFSEAFEQILLRASALAQQCSTVPVDVVKH